MTYLERVQLNSRTNLVPNKGRNLFGNLSRGRSLKYRPPIIIRPNVQVSGGTGQGDYNTPIIKAITLDLSVSRSEVQFFVSGTILWYYQSTNVTDQIQIRIADRTADQLFWGPGNGIEGIPFSSVWISNSVIAGATARISYFTDTPEKPVRFF